MCFAFFVPPHNYPDMPETPWLQTDQPIEYKVKTQDIILIKCKMAKESFVETWMNLEAVMQSEVNQKEENSYLILTHTYGI